VMLSGCSNWLDLQPSDRVSEETAFSSLAGFKKALNGVYVDLNDEALYGKALSCEMVEILAQRYDINHENKEWTALMTYDYTGSYMLGRVERIWGKAYNLIANTNLILKNCEEHRDVLPDDYYKLVKGEALALRGLLHFDLYRLFGPIYGKDSSLTSIPYYSEFVLSVNPSLPGTEFMKNVISDFRTAEELLTEDPIVTYGVQGDPSDAFKKFRNLRLNYYAVQGLLARAYMYTGRLDSALMYAQNVIEVHDRVFPWTDRTLAAMGQAPDRMFSSEIMFASQNKNVNSLYSTLFNGEVLKGESLLGIRDDVARYKFQEGETDLRVLSFLKNTVTVGGSDYWLFNKYESPVADSLYAQMIPMIRVSEMFLIASEVLATQGKTTDAAIYFDEFREARGLSKAGSWVSYYLPLEWWKEFIGEGQLFFYYKRLQKESIPSAIDPFDTSVELKSYVLPMPDGETKYN